MLILGQRFSGSRNRKTKMNKTQNKGNKQKNTFPSFKELKLQWQREILGIKTRLNKKSFK